MKATGPGAAPGLQRQRTEDAAQGPEERRELPGLSHVLLRDRGLADKLLHTNTGVSGQAEKG